MLLRQLTNAIRGHSCMLASFAQLLKRGQVSSNRALEQTLPLSLRLH
jgi:hypothetical protein